MAISILPETNDPVAASPMGELADLQNQAAAARAIFRAVSLAAQAQSDRSVSYEDDLPARWHSAVELGCGRLNEVRRIAVESTGPAGRVNWFSSLGLAEAVGAALWHAAGTEAAGLSSDELSIVADAVVDSIDALLQECKKANVMFSAGRVNH